MSVEYPEHCKLEAIKTESRAVSEFLEWLEAEGIVLAQPFIGNVPWGISKLLPITDTPEKLLARFFNIDLKVLETEKRAMLGTIRSGSANES